MTGATTWTVDFNNKVGTQGAIKTAKLSPRKQRRNSPGSDSGAKDYREIPMDLPKQRRYYSAVGQIGDFRQITRYISKMYKIDASFL